MAVTPDQIRAAGEKAYRDYLLSAAPSLGIAFVEAVKAGVRLSTAVALPRRVGITAKQRELFDFIVANTDGGVPPSFDEMAAGIGINSKSGVHRLLTGLEERGFIRRLRNRARAIEIIASPGYTEARP
jgi:hypothetical protein